MRPGAQEVPKRVIARIAKTVDEDFADEYVHTDLCREAMGMGQLGALLVLEPGRLARPTLRRWRDRAAEGLATLEKQEDEEIVFAREYYANVDGVRARLIALSG